MTELLILGAGGNSLGIVDAVEAQRRLQPGLDLRIAGFLDDLARNRGRSVLGYPVLGTIDDAGKYPGCHFVNGISSVASFRARQAIVSRSAVPLQRFATIIHPAAVVSAHAQVGRGCVILANSVICPGAVVEDHVLILQSTTVNHHARIGSHATLSAGITVLGNVEIGSGAFVGGGSSLAPFVKIGPGALVGMGSVVIRDVAAGSVTVGNPARDLPASPHRLQRGD
ncbi:MAG: NeuD/PglB/VioB family sugar acetyltransferase [Candidatus Parcubacteria bacterium]|nr:NeuD/PglB/VioB family sugar acetyltransferase [Burkholderiales bacterium]